jgi:pyrroline-5-carboxylate reductase
LRTPPQIREGMTVVSTLPISPSTEVDRAIILKIFSSIGRCRFLDEKHFDACTALSGSGPAFACIFLEAMADGGVMMGLPRAEALELAAQSRVPLLNDCLTVAYNLTSTARHRADGFTGRRASGADKRRGYQYVYFSPVCTETDILNTAPGGCTIAGLLAMEDGRVRSTIARAIQVATERASELGQPTKK